jgi:hypothetical protein
VDTGFKNGSLIAGWLRDVGCNPQSVADPQLNWAYDVEFPPVDNVAVLKVQMRIANPKVRPRMVTICARLMPAPEHVAAFDDMEVDSKREFWQDLRSMLTREFVEFLIEGTPLVACPTAFQLSVVRFDDGLTLDSFHRSLASVQKACTAAVSLFQERLGGGPAAGGEFAFRKLGMQ